MSFPRTPIRTQAGSDAAVSRSYSLYGPSPKELTPRSKVKALLASIDDESDSADCLRGHRHDDIATSPDPTYELSRMSNATTSGASTELFRSEGDESDGIPAAPRGRLIARLNSSKEIQMRLGSSGGDSPDGKLHERSKKHNLPIGAAPNSGDSLSNFLQNEQTSRKAPCVRSPFQSTSPQSPLTSLPSPAQTSDGSKTAFPNSFRKRKSTAVAMLSGKVTEDDSDPDLPAEPHISTKLQLLVERKREILRAKEQAEAKGKLTSKTNDLLPVPNGFIAEASASDSAGEVGTKRLTQHSRPTRKASKKALEEMNRETQRMSRNMQLAHQAKTKKKMTKESFFTRFSFKTTSPPVACSTQGISSSTVASSTPASDIERIDKETPPTSPEEQTGAPRESPELPGLPNGQERDFTSEDVEAILPVGFCLVDQPLTRPLKHNKHAKEVPNPNSPACPQKSSHLPSRAPRSENALRSMTPGFESDSELEIIPIKKPKRSKVEVFDRLPAHKINEDRPLQTLRALAHMRSPGKQNRGSKSYMTMSDMQTSLQIRARRQAAEQRAEKIRDLKNRGITIQTAEERERDQMELEDLVEKARMEAADITRKEKAAAKSARKQKLANGELCNSDFSSDEDEDYQVNDADESDLDLSGSDEETPDGEEQSIDEEAEGIVNLKEDDEHAVWDASKDTNVPPLIDAEASESTAAGEEREEREERKKKERESCNGDSEEHDYDLAILPPSKRRRTTRVICEDDGEGEIDEFEPPHSLELGPEKSEIPFIPGFSLSSGLSMGMTQAFAATMADPYVNTQMHEKVNSDESQDSLAFLGPTPESRFQIENLEESQQIIQDSQNNNALRDVECSVDGSLPPEIEIHFSQDILMATQDSEIPDPTQDAGFSKTSPIRNRFVSVPPSTVDTVLLSGVTRNSPITKKKGRLRRRLDISDDPSNVNERALPSYDIADTDASINVFDVMKEAARKPATLTEAFDKNKSEAKGMVDDQALESEDEYAGLGGVSDDGNGGEENEEDKKMIDEGEVEVDERKIAAYYAEKERANDEKAVERLFKDINKGMLRRKRGGEFDISDSDDDAEARKRAKRREFAKMRKALLENENVGKIAEDPKKLAFLRAIEDHGDDCSNFLDQLEDPIPTDLDSQEAFNSQSELQPQPATELTAIKQKRPLQVLVTDNGDRLAPSTLRTRALKKPHTLADIRESVSFLVEEPNTLFHKMLPSSSPPSSENEGASLQRDPFTSRRRSNPIIDRLSLKRAESATSTTSRFAFQAPSVVSEAGTFRVPNLLRRATTSQLRANGADENGISISTASTERAAGGGEKADFIKRGGSRKSSIGYFASRERERGTGLKEAERRRRDGLKKIGMSRVGLGGLIGGSFD